MKKNNLWSILMMFILVLGTAIAFSSCSKSDDDDNNGISGGTSKNPLAGTTWNLKDFGGVSVTTNPENYVTWGEYMRFTSTQLIWNSRSGGSLNTTYNITWADDKTFAAVNVADPTDARVFYVISRTSSVLTIYETGDDLYRYLTKK